MSDLRVIDPGKTDAAIAEEIRLELAAPLAQICAILNRHRATGLQIGFNCAPNQYGQFVPSITVVKPL